jgi:ABC-type spermidine/putrescine transport system permease subunit I
MRPPCAATIGASGSGWQALAAPALLLVTITVLLPVGWLFGLSFLDDNGAPSLEHYRRMLAEPSYGRTFRTTFEISLLTTAICILLGYPLAYFLSQLPRRAANLCMIAVLLPFWTSLLVRTYAWLVLLQRSGLINTWGMQLGLWSEPLQLVHNVGGTLIGMVHIMLPFLVLPLYGTMRAIDRDLLRAASSLGSTPGPWLLDRVLSAVAAGARGRLRARLRALPRFLRDAGDARRRQGDDGLEPHRQRYRTVLQLGSGKRAWRRAAGDHARRARPGGTAVARRRPLRRGALSMGWLDRPASDTQITHRSRLWLYGLGVLVLAFLALPTLIVIPMSFSQSQYLEFPPRQWSLRWYEAYFSSQSWMAATATSLKAGSAPRCWRRRSGRSRPMGCMSRVCDSRGRDPGAADADDRSGHPRRHRAVLCLRAAQDGLTFC